MPKCLFVLGGLIIMFSCSQERKLSDEAKLSLQRKAIIWNESIRRSILIQSDFSGDSVEKKFHTDGRIFQLKFFIKGNPIIQKKFNQTGKESSVIYYSKDGLFELRQEICEDGEINCESIYVDGDVFGLFTKWDCDNLKVEEGFYYKGKKIGDWLKYGPNGSITITSYMNYNLMDSLTQIKIL